MATSENARTVREARVFSEARALHETRELDQTQQRVLGLDASQHARILGAPGTGKTRVLVEMFAHALSDEQASEQDVLVLAPNRLVASRLRERIQRRVGSAMEGSPVRTASSFAHALLRRRAAIDGQTSPRLLTGTVHDEAISAVVNARLEQGDSQGVLAPEVLLSAPFRAELRELARVLDDFALQPEELLTHLQTVATQARGNALDESPDPELLAKWSQGLNIAAEVAAYLNRERSDELSASGMLRLAAQELRVGTVTAPKLLLVDDAQELGEGALALLSACASAGSAIWVFGDPDVSAGAFQGERTRVLAGLTSELARRGWIVPRGSNEQLVVLDSVYRHGPEIRGLVRELTGRIGGAGTGVQRLSESAPERVAEPNNAGEAITASKASVQFMCADSESELIGVIAHRMRARKLGLGSAGEPLSWGDMAVVCRARKDAVRVSRLLAGHQVPSGVAAGGVVLREHQIVRELITLMRHARGVQELDAGGVLSLAGGIIGGLDPVAVRRLRGALLINERRASRSEDREAATIDELVSDAFSFPGSEPVVDSAGGRVLRRLGLVAAAGTREHNASATPREVLWAMWDAAKLADRWQKEAVSGRGTRADEANRSLDAVLGLFFALQRHEEQDSTQPVDTLLEELMTNDVPEDSLAQQSARESVTVTTPQGVVGQEFSLVIVIGVQDGVWPNLRARGSLLGTAALERLLQGGLAQLPSRRDTIHDELRLFALASSRAQDELLVVAVSDEENYPSPFFGFGEVHRVEKLPHSRLTLRGATAAARRRAVADLHDDFTNSQDVRPDTVHSLAVLADAGVPGAHPDEWYGVMPVSTEAPLFTQTDADEPRKIPVSPSQLERAEECPLDWVISNLGGGSGNVSASLGTLVHHALETVPGHDPDDLLAAIMSEWKKLPFNAEWESERMKRTAEQMAHGLSHYLREFEASGRELLGKESRFSLDIGRAELRGVADRLEKRTTPDGVEITVIDLKTGRTPASHPEAEVHVQLQAYQLGVSQGAFELQASDAANADHAVDVQTGARTSASLLYVHPDATKGKEYAERKQAELSDEDRAQLIERVVAVADTMAAGEFTARIEHHCSDQHKPGNCRLHIIQAVSHA